jgi:transposase-like protein
MTQQQNNGLLSEVQQVLLDDKDFLRRLLKQALQSLLQAEFDTYINAAPYERREDRQGYRNGSYYRTLKTRVGLVELEVCRDREGNFQSELFRRYQRSEQALVGSMIEMYLQGVSTRKVKHIVEELCGTAISKSQVSNLVKELDAQLTVWRQRPLSCEYPYLVIDARYEKIRTRHGVVSKAVMIVIGVSESGHRDILAIEIGDSESEVFWSEVFCKLKQRGLKGLLYVVSDQHSGLTKALSRHFQGVVWQRCQVHFIRNFRAKLGWSAFNEFKDQLKEVLSAPDLAEAQRRKDILLEKLEPKYLEVASWIDENIEFCLSVFSLPSEHRRRMKSTNMLERLNGELDRRSRVIGIFPDDAACIRVFGSLCQEWAEEWITGKKYLNMEIQKETIKAASN